MFNSFQEVMFNYTSLLILYLKNIKCIKKYNTILKFLQPVQATLAGKSYYCIQSIQYCKFTETAILLNFCLYSTEETFHQKCARFQK